MSAQNPNNTRSTVTNTVLDVLIIGTGFSGICAGILLKKQGIHNFKLYDKNQRIGGCWHLNTYPGIHCDVASHLYCFSFEPNPNWSRIFSPGSEIRDYIEHCAEKYEISPNIEFGKHVKSSAFNETDQLWETVFADGERVKSHHVISGIGGLHVPSYPAITGREEFTGPSMHSAQWNHDVDLSGKRIAVIGTAASAVQIIPEIAKIAGHVDVYQRTPNYILPRNDREYTEQEKSRFSKWPLVSKLVRAFYFYKGELTSFPLVKKKIQGKYALKTQKLVNGYMKMVVKDKALHEELTPNYEIGCKRILLSDNYYAALNRDNVTAVTKGIESIDKTGITDSTGEHREVDIIVYATGFDIEAHVLSIDFVGRNQASLLKRWKKLPDAYEGAMIPEFPNLYFSTGPNTGVGTTSFVFMIERQMEYIVKLIKKANNKNTVEPTPEAMNRFNGEIQNSLQNTVWAGSCSSYYKRDDGKIATLFPYNARNFMKRHNKPNWRHFSIAKKSVSQ